MLEKDPVCYIQTHSRFRVDRTAIVPAMHTSDKLDEKQPAKRDVESRGLAGRASGGLTMEGWSGGRGVL